MTYLGSSFLFSFIISYSFYFFYFFIYFSNALGILAYIYSNNSIFKEHVLFGETILTHFKINSLEITVSYRKILKTTNSIKDLLFYNSSLMKILLIILNNSL